MIQICISQTLNIHHPGHSWLQKCICEEGVSIENGAVIAAGAIVNSDVKAYEIYGGIPARKISDRK